MAPTILLYSNYYTVFYFILTLRDPKIEEVHLSSKRFNVKQKVKTIFY